MFTKMYLVVVGPVFLNSQDTLALPSSLSQLKPISQSA